MFIKSMMYAISLEKEVVVVCNVPVLHTPWLFWGDWAGFATPFAIFIRYKDDQVMIRHEREHVRQMCKLGFFRFTIEYVNALYYKGYENNKFEIEARKASNP